MLPVPDPQHRELNGMQQGVWAISRDRSFPVEPFGFEKEEVGGLASPSRAKSIRQTAPEKSQAFHSPMEGQERPGSQISQTW